VRSAAGATCSRRVIPKQVITYRGCTRYPAGVSISPRIRAAGRLGTPSICLKDCALASIAKEPHPLGFDTLPPTPATKPDSSSREDGWWVCVRFEGFRLPYRHAWNTVRRPWCGPQMSPRDTRLTVAAHSLGRRWASQSPPCFGGILHIPIARVCMERTRHRTVISLGTDFLGLASKVSAHSFRDA